MSGDWGLGAGGWRLGIGGWTARRAASGIAIGLTATLCFVAVQRGEAHKAVTSKYTYNDDVFPIVRDKCAQCHVEHGVAPMSLTTYKDAYPWAESIRAELIAGHMPPWTVDESFGALKHPATLTAHELDVMLTWATGGNPQGDLNQTLPTITLKNDWTLGKPDVTVEMPSAFTIPADKADATEEFTVRAGNAEPRWVRAVDLLPGTPSIVRSAVIALKAPDASGEAAAPTPDRVLALWLPGGRTEAVDAGTGFRLPPNAELSVRIHYKKTWQFEGQALSDRSTIGLYFDPEKDPEELLALPIASPAPPPMDAMNHTFTFKRAVDRDVDALALRPDSLPPNIVVQIEAVLPDGSRAPMIRWNTRADWARRYWFAKPIRLPRGTTIEVVADFSNPDLLSEAFDSLTPVKTAPEPKPLQMALDVVPAHPKPTAQ